MIYQLLRRKVRVYKAGDKVETPHGTGWVKSYSEVYDMYIVDLKGAFKNQQYKPYHLKPHKSAHDKLIEMGFKKNEDGHYQHDFDGDIRVMSETNMKTMETQKYLVPRVHLTLELSRILTQYLEELEDEQR
jgi:hypothetical protein